MVKMKNMLQLVAVMVVLIRLKSINKDRSVSWVILKLAITLIAHNIMLQY